MIHFTAAPILRIPRRRDRPFRMHTITDADGPRLVVAGWRPLTTLADATRAYIDAARSERTRDVYRAQWVTVTARLGRQGRVSARCRQRPRLSLYSTARAQAGRKVSALALALAAISQAHQLGGHV